MSPDTSCVRVQVYSGILPCGSVLEICIYTACFDFGKLRVGRRRNRYPEPDFKPKNLAGKASKAVSCKGFMVGFRTGGLTNMAID